MLWRDHRSFKIEFFRKHDGSKDDRKLQRYSSSVVFRERTLSWENSGSRMRRFFFRSRYRCLCLIPSSLRKRPNESLQNLKVIIQWRLQWITVDWNNECLKFKLQSCMHLTSWLNFKINCFHTYICLWVRTSTLWRWNPKNKWPRCKSLLLDHIIHRKESSYNQCPLN